MGSFARVAWLVAVVTALVVGLTIYTTSPQNPGAPATTGTDNPGPQTAPPVEFDTGGVGPDYDADRVRRDVERMRGHGLTGDVTVTEYDRDEYLRGRDGAGAAPNSFAGIEPAGAAALQLASNASVEPGVPVGFTEVTDIGSVRIRLLDETALADAGWSQQVVLAHELVHAIQIQQGLSPYADDVDDDSTDAVLARRARVEGDAVLTAERYAAEHNLSKPAPETFLGTAGREQWVGSLQGVIYYYGLRYYRASNGSTEARDRILTDGPTTMRRILHPDAPPANETVRRLPYSLSDGRYDKFDGDRPGELVVRHTLRLNGYSFERASAVAAGWQDGRMAYYAGSDGTVNVTIWQTAWANASEAEEFATAWRALLDRRNATREGALLRVPATEHTPELYYHVHRDGPEVTVVASRHANLTRTAARDLDQLGNESAVQHAAALPRTAVRAGSTAGTGVARRPSTDV